MVSLITSGGEGGLKMNIMRFQEMQPLLDQKGEFSLLIKDEALSIELPCRVLGSDLSDIVLLCQDKDLNEYLQEDQMISAIFKCELGIYGFHCAFSSFETTSSEAIFKSPPHVWKIERRQFPRTDVDKTILCDEAHLNVDHYEPAHLVSESRLMNICKTGLAVQSNVRVTVGEHLFVLLDLAAHMQADSLCVVVWAVENQGEETEFDYTYGVRFVNVSSRILETIEDFVSLQLLLSE